MASRLTTPPPPSPLDLMQEYYAHDAWRLLISCVLMSRVSSHNTKSVAIAAFFSTWPTPSAALAAAPEALQAVMHPLGLFPNRLQSIVAVSERFLSQPAFHIELKGDCKIFGIGEFGLQSFLSASPGLEAHAIRIILALTPSSFCTRQPGHHTWRRHSEELRHVAAAPASRQARR